ncbi:MAG: DNA primase [Parachlamydia sp.]|jgi:DNA primase|nr:DNA primase [Parachlamydia sp.]
MAIFKKDSLETLRQRVDLVEVLSSHVELKRSGASYKGLCPFHDEKSPSFIVQKGDTHYHCFGCGAHGDAIQFLMAYQKMNFSEAVESLANRFHVHLEKIEGEGEQKGLNKAILKSCLETASNFYHFCLLYTPEGQQALSYLFQRGIDLAFIHAFKIGLAPKQAGLFRKMMHAKAIKDEALLEAGLLSSNPSGQMREFFNDRILFPIQDAQGSVIGFSGRKYKEETFGGKYVNTPETPLFKKSRVLFGFHHSRKRIAKERKAIVVEGQVDALRLIQSGLNFTVAGQGTAFGDEHVRELVNLGINIVYLAMDGDLAGEEAACKIGHLFQKEGVEVKIVNLPAGSDPDQFLRENGPEKFLDLLEKSLTYIQFLVKYLSKDLDVESAAGKNEIVQKAVKMIREWDHPVMVHETLRKLAHLLTVPEDMVGVGKDYIPNLYIKKSASIGHQSIDPDRILETDLLRWLLLHGTGNSRLIEIVYRNLVKEDFVITICQKIFDVYRQNYESQRPCDLLSLAIDLDDAEGQLVLSDLIQKKVNKDKAEQLLVETVKKLLDRNWMLKREEIKMKIQSGGCSDDQVLELVHRFDELKRQPPQMVIQ